MNEVQQIGNMVDDTNIGFKNPQRGRIYSADGVSPALNTNVYPYKSRYSWNS